MLLVTLVNRFFDACLVAGVVWPFIPQGHLMYATRDASGWNTHTSLLLIVASTLRVFFYYCKAFDEVFLVQAVACIVTQLSMTYIVVKVARKRPSPGGGITHRSSHTLYNSGFTRFWRWTDTQSYFLAVGLLASACYAVSLLFWRSTLYREALGTMALGVEAFVPVPQAWQNASRRSTVGLSAVLIICWAVGDAFKTALALERGVPIQFVLCGIFQLTMDIVLLWQIYIKYPERTDFRRPLITASNISRVDSGGAGKPFPSGYVDAESPLPSSDREPEEMLVLTRLGHDTPGGNGTLVPGAGESSGSQPANLFNASLGEGAVPRHQALSSSGATTMALGLPGPSSSISHDLLLPPAPA